MDLLVERQGNLDDLCGAMVELAEKGISHLDEGGVRCLQNRVGLRRLACRYRQLAVPYRLAQRLIDVCHHINDRPSAAPQA